MAPTRYPSTRQEREVVARSVKPALRRTLRCRNHDTHVFTRKPRLHSRLGTGGPKLAKPNPALRAVVTFLHFGTPTWVTSSCYQARQLSDPALALTISTTETSSSSKNPHSPSSTNSSVPQASLSPSSLPNRNPNSLQSSEVGLI
ncbi:unnamed protein product [Dovyalis caffra]|uniref:Uncharacterized protein n=1 Tax=Dovyalis caffra TaxID=77055 RepID=A0AAV1S522_9ROSI|nr:unnamed protein product [Dovyalis caffra]